MGNEVSDRVIQECVDRISLVCRPGRSYPLHEPFLDFQDAEEVNRCIKSGWVSYVGPATHEFETALSSYTGIPHVICTSSGTTALQLLLRGLDIQPESEVLVPALTFAATAAAIIHAGAIPHFVDVEECALGVDPAALDNYLSDSCRQSSDGKFINVATGRVVSALLPVHTFGLACRIKELRALADSYNILLVEDAAEGLGSTFSGQHVGGFGHGSILSFNGNKIVTTGGGGAVLTYDLEVAERVRHLSSTAKTPHPWRFFHDEVGFNFRLPSLNAALGVSQMRKLESMLATKRTLHSDYKSAFDGFSSATVINEPDDGSSNYWLSTIRWRGLEAGGLDRLLQSLHEHRIMARPIWEPLHTLAPYKHFPHAPLPVTEMLARELVSLPSGVGVREV